MSSQTFSQMFGINTFSDIQVFRNITSHTLFALAKQNSNPRKTKVSFGKPGFLPNSLSHNDHFKAILKKGMSRWHVGKGSKTNKYSIKCLIK